MRLAMDAMGGDNAPREPVLGALQAVQTYPDAEIILVGHEEAIRRFLPAGIERQVPRLSIHHAPECVEMGDAPIDTLRSKPRNSITESVALVAAGKADAAISAGNTGAFVAAATLALRPLAGVRRPGIAVAMPSITGHTTVIDMGANIQCKPIHLFQYAVMASIYHRYVVGIAKPTVGLLNVGSEDGKGTPLMKKAYSLLAASSLNFIGNVEGGDIFNGRCDVVVCDGFVGNVLLKAAEGFGESIMHSLREAGRRDLWGRLGLNLLRPTLREMAKWTDFAEYGGAPLLGVEGECIICHGRSDARAFCNAIRSALAFARQNVNSHIVAAIAAEQAALANAHQSAE